jgi:hypothetical protein
MRLHELFTGYDAIVVETGGVGRVVAGVNTTPDVGPDEIVKQAKKFGFKVTKDGIPPKLRSDGKTRLAR